MGNITIMCNLTEKWLSSVNIFLFTSHPLAFTTWQTALSAVYKYCTINNSNTLRIGLFTKIAFPKMYIIVYDLQKTITYLLFNRYAPRVFYSTILNIFNCLKESLGQWLFMLHCWNFDNLITIMYCTNRCNHCCSSRSKDFQ